jgi:branched-chain amino acid transport system substrate-binding protein
VLDNARPYAFSMVQPDDANSTPVLAKLVTSKGWKRAAIIVDEATATDKAQGDIYQKVFQQTNVPVVVKATFSAGDSSFAAQISQIKAANPDVLALAAGPDDAGRIAQEARSQGLTATFIGTGSLQAGGPAYYAAGKDATNGTLTATQYDPNNPADPAKSLLAKARADTGKAVVTLNFAYGFDAFNIIAKIIKEKGIKPGDDPAKSRTSIEEALNNLGTYEGMAGKTQFTSQGTAERPQLLSIMQGGQFIVEHSG